MNGTDTSTYVEYSSNNSGGDWWLTDDNWRALEAAGWEVDWFATQEHKFFPADDEGRWLGALASHAKRSGLSFGDAIREWERLTGQSSTDLGCSCCGTPHSFTYYKDGRYADSYSPDYPTTGESYGGEL